MKKDLALAYGMRRKAKKMQAGGMAEDMKSGMTMEKVEREDAPAEEMKVYKSPSAERQAQEMHDAMKRREEYNSGVDAEEDDILIEANKHRHARGGMVSAIMRNRREKLMAEGGMVDLEEHSEEHPNDYDRLNMLAAKKEMYDDSQLSAQPMDSNEMGDMEEMDEENKHDMLSKMRARIKSKRGL